MKNAWSESDDELICDHYQKKGLDHLTTLLPDRSRRSIIIRAHRLGVKGRLWTAPEEYAIRQCYRTYGAAYCRKYMPYRSIAAIKSRARHLGVRRDLTLRGREESRGDYLQAIELLKRPLNNLKG